jgi:cytoskeletal protein CcmA (bactofilin family)
MMFGRKTIKNLDKVDTLIGKGTVFQGTLKAEGTLRIDGKLEGEVESLGNVVVGEAGFLQASIKASNLLVAGAIKGDVFISGKVELASSGRIDGNITAASLIIDDGATFHGACNMIEEVSKTKKQ